MDFITKAEFDGLSSENNPYMVQSYHGKAIFVFRGSVPKGEHKDGTMGEASQSSKNTVC